MEWRPFFSKRNVPLNQLFHALQYHCGVRFRDVVGVEFGCAGQSQVLQEDHVSHNSGGLFLI